MNKRLVGTENENKASKYLTEIGYDIVEKNFRVNFGEIDIIGKENGYLCFIEVKYRKKNGLTLGLEAVNIKKQKTIYNVAMCYLKYKGLDTNTKCRFDVVSIDGDDITLIKDAFP